MCVSQHIFCCFCRGNFEYCTRLTVKSVIHPLVDLPSVLALKTNNLSLDWVYSCLNSGRKTGRLKKIRPLAALVLIFFFALSAQVQVLRAMKTNSLAIIWQWHCDVTHTHMKNRRKRREKWKKRMSVSHLSEQKGKKRKKDVLGMWISYKRTCKIQWTRNADIQANF